MDRIDIGSANTYMYYDTDAHLLNTYVRGSRALSLYYEGDPPNGFNGGNMHGMWYAEHLVHVSDRRLKKNILPIREALDARAESVGATEDSANWVLRELRPVSYRFKSGPESKWPRFGFIADEVQATIPQVIRENPATTIKGIMYEDLLAVLTTVLQSMQSQLEGSDVESKETRHRLDSLEARLLKVENIVDQEIGSLRLGLRRIEALLEQRLPDLGASSRLRGTSQDDGAHGFEMQKLSGRVEGHIGHPAERKDASRTEWPSDPKVGEKERRDYTYKV
jgi:hypothetical protein